MNEEINSYESILKAQEGDEYALNALVGGNIALVKSIVAKFLNRGVEFDDLMQIGSIGLIRAVQRFDTSYDVKFSTYAVPMIMGEIKRFLRDNGTIKVSRTLKEIACKAIRISEEIKNQLGREATLEEVADKLEISVDDLVVAMDSIKTPMSLDEALYDDNDKSTILDSLQDNNQTGETVLDRIMLKQMLSQLPVRDRQIIILRYFQDKTQSEVARQLNISQVQVSRLEGKILKQLKNEIC